VYQILLAHEARNFFAKKRQKCFADEGSGQDPSGNPLSAGFFCGPGEASSSPSRSVMLNQGRSKGRRNARIAKLRMGAEAQVGTRSAWFEEPREARAQRCDSDVDVKGANAWRSSCSTSTSRVSDSIWW